MGLGSSDAPTVTTIRVDAGDGVACGVGAHELALPTATQSAKTPMICRPCLMYGAR